MKSLLLLFVSLCCSATVCLGQFNVQLTSTESTCPNNGSITITATDVTEGTSGDNCSGIIQIKITNGPTANGQTYPGPALNQESCSDGTYTRTFAGLYPGTYTVEVIDVESDPQEVRTQDVTVEGNYQDPLLSLTGEDITCSGGSNGSITANMTQGLSPYEYAIKLTSEPDTEYDNTRQSGNVFDGLEAGVYSVRSYDACGNFQTREYTLEEDVASDVKLYTAGPIYRLNCNEVQMGIGVGSTGSPEYTYTWTNPPAGYTGTVTQGPTTDISATWVLPLDDPLNPQNSTYTFEVTDDCGNTATVSRTPPSYSMRYSLGATTCTDWNFTLSPSAMVEPLTINLTSYPDGYTPDPNQGLEFTDVPFGCYSGTVTDACGKELPFTRCREVIAPIYRDAIIDEADCEEGLGKVTLRLVSQFGANQYAQPLTYTLLNPPAGYSPTSQTNPTFRDLPEGTYNFKIEDNCNNDPIEVTVDLNTTLETMLSASVTQGCFNNNTITSTFTANNGAYARYDLYDESGSRIASNDADGVFNNVPPGTYTVRAKLYGNNSLPECWRETEVTVTDSNLPTINPVRGYACSSDDLISTTAAGITGVAPFTFDLLRVESDGSFTELQTGASSPVFTGLDASQTYKIRVVDACGNSSNGDVAVIDSGFSFQRQGSDCAAEGGQYPFYLRNYADAEITWTSPDGSEVFTGNDVRDQVGALQEADYGDWVVDINFNDGCRTGQYTYTLLTCAALPLEWDSFKVSQINNDVKLDWSTSSEIDTDVFRIMKSVDGIDWLSIGEITASGNSNEARHYTFTDKDPFLASNYYQIQSIDANGDVSFTGIKYISLSKTKNMDWSLVPNMTRNTSLLRAPNDSKINNIVVNIYDIGGRLVKSTEYDQLSNSMMINVSELTTGLYVFRVTDVNGNALYNTRLNIIK